MSDYNSDFLTMLETWDAAVSYLPSLDGKSVQPIVIAELLGWTQARTGGGEQMNRTGAKWMGSGESLRGACGYPSGSIMWGYLWGQ